MRVHVEERDKFQGQPLYERIVQLLRRRHFAGATAYRAVEGFGATGRLHHHEAWSLALDCPVIIESVDTDERIKSVLPELDRMIGGGVITLERVRVIMYRKKMPPGELEPRASSEVADF
jgi:PII-like signaling protein